MALFRKKNDPVKTELTKLNHHLQHITLIIPTYNRPEFLARLLQYYASKNTEIHFLILDSSHEETTLTLNEQATHILGNQAHHVRFSPSVPVATKLLEGLKLVETPYCAFCADDDLVFIEGISQALEFFQKNQDYVCVDGIYLNFNPIKTDVHLIVEYATQGINAEDPASRIFRLCQKYESLFYGVFKTQQALAIFTGVTQNSTLHYQELFQAASALILGKSHRLPIFYAARQHCTPADQERDKWQTYYWFADNAKEFLDHYLVYREELWTFYQTHVTDQKHSKETFSKWMDLAHAVYFGSGCPPEYFHTVLQSHTPTDPFKKPNMFQENICNQLKSPVRQTWEKNLDKCIAWLPKKLSSFHSKRDTTTLNKAIQHLTQINWNCALSEELRWFTSIDIFRSAYQELCQYMSFFRNKESL